MTLEQQKQAAMDVLDYIRDTEYVQQGEDAVEILAIASASLCAGAANFELNDVMPSFISTFIKWYEYSRRSIYLATNH